MSKNQEQIFDECLERMFRGESIESCLSSYPNEAAYLEPLLRTAFGVSNRAAMLRPAPEFKARARMRIEGAWQYAAQHRPVEKPGGFSWQRSWAFALTAIVLLLFSSVGTAFASSEALPDETLYGAKLATEQVTLAFTFSEENKAALHAQYAEKRAQEIAVMAKEGKTDYVVATATRLTYQMEQAEFAIQRLEQKEAAQPVSIAIPLQPTPPAPASTAPQPAPAAPEAATLSEEAATGGEKASPPLPADVVATRSQKAQRARGLVKNSISKNLVVLEGVLEEAPDAAKPALNQVINRTRQVQQRTLQPGIYKPQSQDGKPPQDTHGIPPDKPRPTSEQPPLPPKPRPVEPSKPRTDQQPVVPQPLKPEETQKPPQPTGIPKPPSDISRPSGITNTQPGVLPAPVTPSSPADSTSK